MLEKIKFMLSIAQTSEKLKICATQWNGGKKRSIHTVIATIPVRSAGHRESRLYGWTDGYLDGTFRPMKRS